jgi:hypothetical protein
MQRVKIKRPRFYAARGNFLDYRVSLYLGGAALCGFEAGGVVLVAPAPGPAGRVLAGRVGAATPDWEL